MAKRQHEERMRAVDHWVKENQGEEQPIMPGV
jgi:hypothetical protein